MSKNSLEKGLKLFTTALCAISVIIPAELIMSVPVHAAKKNDYHIHAGGADVGISEIDIEDISNRKYSQAFSDDSALDNIDMTSPISEGVYADTVDLSGLTYEEAEKAINQYISSLRSDEVVLYYDDEHHKAVSAGELGITWKNREILAKAVKLGKSGNFVDRYKELKDLQHENHVYSIELSFDKDALTSAIQSVADEFDIKAINRTATRENGKFILSEGRTGYEVDVEGSTRLVMNALNKWNGGTLTADLKVDVSEPKGTQEDFDQMTDVLGTFTTSFSSSNADRSGNVKNGTNLCNGTLLYPGEHFSMYKTVSPFTEANGYFLAGSYANGQVVESFGGGICQVSSTLYNAVLRAELQVDERYNHSMIVGYVNLSSDAAISGTSKDFKFTNNTDAPIYIESYTTDDKKVVFNIYGKETRPSNRTVEYESVEISRTEPQGDRITADSSRPVGFISSQSAHIGYVGELWKVVKVDGVEVERKQINKSTYQMSPRTATVGIAAADPSVTQAVQSAIATGNLDSVRATVSSLQALATAAAAPPEPAQEQATFDPVQ